MIVKASGRSALILATGLFVGFAAGPSAAAPANADNAAASATAAHLARHGKTYAHRRSSKEAPKPPAGDKAVAAIPDDNSPDSSAIPSSVANANAQLPSGDALTRSATRAMSARANDLLQNATDNLADDQPAAGIQLVSADQLNDVDRASVPAAPAQMMAAAEPPAAPVVASSSSESSTWDQTSLIGKIFIGFGALLTMASAARMFMA
jgi:hypothetical protein